MNKTSHHISKHFSEIYFGGNWTCSNLKDQLSDVTWLEATTKLYNLNTIATLTYHIHYYVKAVSAVLNGDSLRAKDELSFTHPTIHSQEDWTNFLEQIWQEAHLFSDRIKTLSDDTLEQNFTDVKYGIYYRNLQGIIEHSHYHLGQISLIKKIIRQSS